MAAASPAGVYLHVPFCRAICSYCAFAKGEFEPVLAQRWLQGVARELEVRARTTWTGKPAVDTVFFGGGTPSTLPLPMWGRLRELLDAHFRLQPGLEFTSEANPESVTPGVVAAMREAGVNRISLGVQSTDPAELAKLERLHDAGGARRAVETARVGGFDNLSVDLMYGLPGQAPAVFERSLGEVLAWDPDHLSVYCLGLEPGTPLAARVEEGAEPVPVDEPARDMYDGLLAATAAAGYRHYELSNFCRGTKESRHNLKYWRREDVIALGPSAHGLFGGRRWANPAPLGAWEKAYTAGPVPVPKPVSRETARFEWVFLRLRLMNGFLEDDFAREWGEPFAAVYGETADRLAGAGWLYRAEGRVRLEPAAYFLSDAVFSEFAP